MYSPTKTITWIGVTFCSNTMTMSISSDKIQQALLLTDVWMGKSAATTKQLKKIAGLLFHCIKCAPGARPFLNNLLADLSKSYNSGHVSISEDTLKDLCWFRYFLSATNGIKLLAPNRKQITVVADACLQASGALYDKKAYTFKFPSFFVDLKLHISAIECLNVLLAIRLWSADWCHRQVTIKVDNTATYYALSRGKAKEPILNHSAREIWYIATAGDIVFNFEYTPGHTMQDSADALSRAHLGGQS